MGFLPIATIPTEKAGVERGEIKSRRRTGVYPAKDQDFLLMDTLFLLTGCPLMGDPKSLLFTFFISSSFFKISEF